MQINKSFQVYEVTTGQWTYRFSRNLGISRINHDYSFLPPNPGISFVEWNVYEMKYLKPDGNYFHFKTPVDFSLTYKSIDTSVTSPKMYLRVVANHAYTGLYSLAIDFWESLTANFLYHKPGFDTIHATLQVPRESKEIFGGTIPLDSVLILRGYIPEVYFKLSDRSPGPNVIRVPETGTYSIEYRVEGSDFYSVTPGYVNYYQKYMLSPTLNDTIYAGEAVHQFLNDTIINSKQYKREVLFGDTLYFVPDVSGRRAAFYRLLPGGSLSLTGTDDLNFSTGGSGKLHYFTTGTGMLFAGYSVDTLAGVSSRLYSLRGDINVDEELVFKAGTGPVLLTRYESETYGYPAKVIYRLSRVVYDGHEYIVTSPETSPNPVLPESISISDNFPNPFNPSTRVKILTGSEVVLSFTLYRSEGERISSFTKYYPSAGEYIEEFNLTGQSSGVLFLTISGNGKPVKVLKLLFLK